MTERHGHGDPVRPRPPGAVTMGHGGWIGAMEEGRPQAHRAKQARKDLLVGRAGAGNHGLPDGMAVAEEAGEELPSLR